jgi:hypothetical protein
LVADRKVIASRLARFGAPPPIKNRLAPVRCAEDYPVRASTVDDHLAALFGSAGQTFAHLSISRSSRGARPFARRRHVMGVAPGEAVPGAVGCYVFAVSEETTLAGDIQLDAALLSLRGIGRSRGCGQGRRCSGVRYFNLICILSLSRWP